MSAVRRHVAACLSAWRLTDDDQHWSLLIVGELAGNAAVHGRADMTVSLGLSATDLSIQVTDYGDAPCVVDRPPASPEDERGRGLGIVCSLAHTLDSTTTVDATQVRAVYRVERRDHSEPTDRTAPPRITRSAT